MNAKLVIIASFLWALSLAPLALGQTTSANPPVQNATDAAATSSTDPDAKPVEDLLLATQRLRDAISDMLNEPAGPKRTELIRAGDRALAEAEDAMLSLPPELLLAEVNENSYKQSVDHLQKATQNLQEAAQALANNPNAKQRSETIKKIKTALQETQRLMQAIPRGASGK